MKIIKTCIQLGVLSAIIFCLLLSAAVQAEEASRIYDNAGLFSEEEQQKLTEEIQNFQDKTGMDCAVATTDDAEGKSARDYADDLYEEKGIGAGTDHDGMLYLIDLDNREIYISTEGEALRYLTDERLDRILDHAYEDASDGDYAASAVSVLSDARSFILEGVPENQYNYSSETGRKDPYRRKGFPFPALLAGILAGAAASLGTFFSIRSRYRLTRETYRYPLSEKSSLHLTESQDHLVNQFVTHRRIPKNPPSSSRSSGSGRTTTHRSSSGRTHGGRGRRL